MIKVVNKNTGVIKELSTEELVSMYLSTGEWDLLQNKKIEKTIEKPIEQPISKPIGKSNFFSNKERQSKGK